MTTFEEIKTFMADLDKRSEAIDSVASSVSEAGVQMDKLGSSLREIRMQLRWTDREKFEQAVDETDEQLTRCVDAMNGAQFLVARILFESRKLIE